MDIILFFDQRSDLFGLERITKRIEAIKYEIFLDIVLKFL